MTPSYYIVPDVEAYARASGEERQKLARRIAATVGDPTVLRVLLGADPAEFSHFYPDMRKPDLSTDEAIESFIGKYGSQSHAATEAAELTDSLPSPLTPAEASRQSATDDDGGLIPLAPPAFDITAIEASPIIEAEERRDATDATASVLEAFLGNGDSAGGKETETERPTAPAPEAPETARKEAPLLSESLARVMIKNGNYRKALEIITDLSLNNPKKSVYFADQIRFLKKLILNQSKTRQ